jgi:hypothetical protein
MEEELWLIDDDEAVAADRAKQIDHKIGKQPLAGAHF